MRIPIVVVAYNRLSCLDRLLNSLNRAEYEKDDVELIISIDRGDNAQVLELAQRFHWLHGTKRVIYQSENLGLKKHILRCGDISGQYDAFYENRKLRCTDGSLGLVVDLYGRKPIPSKECYFLTSASIPDGAVIDRRGICANKHKTIHFQP